MDYREILSENFQKKRKVNPRYSLRAFARDISISPSRLSEIISGKGELSRAKGVLIAKRLLLNPAITADFLDLIDAATSSQSGKRDEVIERVKKRSAAKMDRQIDNDSFKIIADPVYLMVWSFMMLPSYNGEPAMIEKYLKLNSLELFHILKRLEEVNLVKRDASRWLCINGTFSVGDSAPSDSIRAFHRQMNQMGGKAIEAQSMQTRHLDSAIIPFNSNRMFEAKQKIVEFTQALVNEFGDEGSGDSVYGFSMQFFRMSEPIERKVAK